MNKLFRTARFRVASIKLLLSPDARSALAQDARAGEQRRHALLQCLLKLLQKEAQIQAHQSPFPIHVRTQSPNVRHSWPTVIIVRIS